MLCQGRQKHSCVEPELPRIDHERLLTTITGSVWTAHSVHVHAKEAKVLVITLVTQPPFSVNPLWWCVAVVQSLKKLTFKIAVFFPFLKKFFFASLNTPPPPSPLCLLLVGRRASTSGRLHSEFVRRLFLQAHRETDRFFPASGVHYRNLPVPSSTTN